jgi:hypothetical protein
MKTIPLLYRKKNFFLNIKKIRKLLKLFLYFEEKLTIEEIISKCRPEKINYLKQVILKKEYLERLKKKFIKTKINNNIFYMSKKKICKKTHLHDNLCFEADTFYFSNKSLENQMVFDKIEFRLKINKFYIYFGLIG